jgi:heme o synthase
MKPREPAFSIDYPRIRSWFGDLAQITKAGLTGLSVATAAIGAYLASGGRNTTAVLVHVVVGTYVLGSGAAVLNQFLERHRDALMSRTAARPLPSGRITAGCALAIGGFLTGVGLAYLALATTLLATLLGFLTVALYVGAYTPLKPKTHLATLVGAIPGSLPPLIGWAAVAGEVPLAAYVLFLIMFLWQIPHFLSLGWLYREDYERGGYRLLPVIDRTGLTTARLSLIYAICMIPALLLLPLCGLLQPLVSLILLPPLYLFVRKAVKFRVDRTEANARQLFLASLVLLPLFLGALAVGRMTQTW